MDRSHQLGLSRRTAVVLSLILLLPFTGCLQRIVATAAYLTIGPNIDAECEALDGKRVAVLCRPPASLEYRYAGADQELAKRIGNLLRIDGDKIDVVDHREVENWLDQKDFSDHDMQVLAKDVGADMVLKIELETFSLLEGQTLRRGRASADISVYDVSQNGELVWTKPLDEFLFPANSAVPIQEKSEKVFRSQYLNMLASKIAKSFYEHDKYADVANDGLAHR